MKMVPPAGVEPATYRLGGEYSTSTQRVDFEDKSDSERPILLAVQHADNSLISKGVDSDFGRPFSSLTEHPADKHPRVLSNRPWNCCKASFYSVGTTTSQGDAMMQGQYSSVVSERPDEPIWWDGISQEAYLVWLWLGIAGLTLLVVGLILDWPSKLKRDAWGYFVTALGVIAWPIVAPINWWLERRIRVLRTIEQYYCHRCRRGTNHSADKSRCLECFPDKTEARESAETSAEPVKATEPSLI